METAMEVEMGTGMGMEVEVDGWPRTSRQLAVELG